MSLAQAPGVDPRDAFARQLGAIRQRIWLERAGVVVTRGLTVGFLFTLVLAVAAWFLRYPVPPLWYAVPLLVPLAGSLIVAAFLYPSPTSAARIADHRLELAEQLGTAVEVSAEDTEELIALAQVGAAAQTAAWADQNWRGGPRLGRDLALAAMLGFIAAGVLLLTGPEGRGLLGPRAVAQPVPEAEPRAAVVPSPPAVAKTDQPPTPPPAAKPQQGSGQGQGQGQGRTAGVQRAVDDIRRSREAGSLDAGQAAQRLAQAEAELSRQAAQSGTDKSALDRLGQAFDQVSAGRPAAEALQRGDYQQAAQEIASLGTESDQLSQDAKNQLARALREAANDSSSSPELSQRERRAADALASKDYEAARQAMADLGDQVGMRGRNVIPQSELSRAWDQVNQERRAEGQPDSPGSARQQQPNPQQARGQQGQQAQRGQGQQGQQGQSQQPQPGNGNGSAPSQGGPPGETPPDAPAPRLDAQGKPVEVEVKPGQQGQRPGDADKPDDKPLDEVGSVSASSSGSPGQVTSAAPPEINFVPSGRRDVVREYFRGQNQSGGQSNQEGR